VSFRREDILARSAVKVQASAEAAQFLHTDVTIQESNVTRGAVATTIGGKKSSNVPNDTITDPGERVTVVLEQYTYYSIYLNLYKIN
jgi:hypothetical protein